MTPAGSAGPALDETFAAGHRIELDATSWAEHAPDWLTGGQQLPASLIAPAAWSNGSAVW